MGAIRQSDDLSEFGNRRALMLGCLAEAHARDHDVIGLGVWERNPRAQAFYGKWGVETVGTIAFQLGSELQNDFVMQGPVLMVR